MHFSMEDMMMGKQTSISNNSSTSFFNPLGIRNDSKRVNKGKPKIRIIHIFAPEIIKTDVANFREIVQRLTGKPEKLPENSGQKRKKPRFSQQEEVMKRMKDHHHHHHQQQPTNLMSAMDGHEDLCFTFSEIDGFIHDISELPLLPVYASQQHVLP